MDDGATYFAEVSRELLGSLREPGTSQRIADRAVDVVPGCDLASVALRGRRRRVETVAVSSATAAQLDAWQYELGEGPCLAALASESISRIDDVGEDEQWPRWSQRAQGHGSAAVLSVPLSTPGKTLGTLNLYAGTPFAFEPPVAVDRATVFAAHAAGALHAAQTATGLRTALESRHLIGIAQGIMMQRYDLSAATAFEVLRRYSSHTNVKLREVARQVTEQGGLPHDHPGLAPLATESRPDEG